MFDPLSLKGVYAAFASLFDSQDRINEKATVQLAQFLISKGLTGFYTCGSTGEFLTLTPQERMQILEIAVSEAKGKAKVIAHVGAPDTKTAIMLAKHAAKVGADAISSVAPFYYRYSPDEVTSYYLDIIEASGMPMIIYNYASNGNLLTHQNAPRLFGDSRIAGVKHTSSDFFMLEQMKTAHPEKVFFNGSDEMLSSGLTAGADGGIGSTYNVMPQYYAAIYKHFLDNDMEKAKAVQKKANKVIAAMISGGVLPSVKYLLNLLGIDAGVCRKPFLPLPEESKKKLQETFQEIDY